MKKILLSCLVAAACAGSALAAEPQLLTNLAFQHISANGKVAVSDVSGYLTIYELATGKQTVFGPDDDEYTEYYAGNGNCITADGSIVLASANEKAIYIKDGKIYELEVPNPERTNSNNGITPDGSRICGNVGMADMADAYIEDVTMCVPAYWDRNADGEGYGSYHLLPAPKLDLFGRAPQYVKAIVISSDGKTIAGQITDAQGFYEYPIVYQQDEKGEWSYSLPAEKYFNPDNIPAVEYPGESPESPNPVDYLSGERKEAYQTAYENSEWPNAVDYMTDEEKAAYAAALEKYQAEYEVWDEKFTAYQDYYFSAIEASPNFLTNNVYLSTDGKKYVGTLIRTVENNDPMSWLPWKQVYTPCSIELTSGEMNVVDTEISCAVSCVADNDIILANNERGSIPMVGYIIKDGEIQTIEAYIASKSAAYGEWIKTNMSHEVIVGYEYNEEDDEYEEIMEEVVYTGRPVVTPDMSLVTFWNDRSWDYDYEFMVETVVFDMTAVSGITAITARSKDLSVDENGNLNVPEGFASVQIFNVNGACVKTVETTGTVDLNLNNGVYIAKGTRTDGSVSIIKLAK